MKKDIARVFGSNLIKMLVTLITAFVVPMVLSVDNYGYFKLYTFYASYVGVSHLGFCDGIYLKYGGIDITSINNKQIKSEWVTLLCYEAVVSLIILFAGLMRHELIIICLGATVIPSVLFTFYTYVFQATGEFVRYTRIMNISTAFNLIINLLLVLLRIKDYRIYVICYVGINVYSFMIGSFSFKRQGWLGKGYGISGTVFSTMVKSGILLMIGNFAYTLFIGIDKWFIKFTMDITDFSMYSFAGQLITVVNMFVTPISMTLFSNISRRRDANFEIRIKKILVVFLMIFPTAIFVLTFIIRNFMKQYIPAIEIVSILIITQMFLSLNLAVFINMYKAYKKQKEYFLRLLFALGVAALSDLIVFLINPNVVGYASATLISCFVWLGLNMKYFPHLAPDKRELLYVFIMIGTYLLTLLFRSEIVRLIIYLPMYLIITRILMNEEWRYSLDVLGKVLSKLANHKGEKKT